MTLAERAAQRRKHMQVGRARSHEEAEQWDLAFWQSLTPQERLDAYMAIRLDIEAVGADRSGEIRQNEHG